MRISVTDEKYTRITVTFKEDEMTLSVAIRSGVREDTHRVRRLIKRVVTYISAIAAILSLVHQVLQVEPSESSGFLGLPSLPVLGL